MIEPVEHLRGIEAHLRIRLATAIAFVATLVVLVGYASVTFPNLQNDVVVPRTPAYLPIGCVAAAWTVLLLRPLLPEPERLAVRNAVLGRAILYGLTTSVVLGLAGLGCLALPNPRASWQAVCATAALVGIALAASRLGGFAGLLVPWLYVISGLAFGYQRLVGGGTVDVRPWAWLVSPDPPILGELATYACGLAIAASFRPLGDRE